MTWFRVDDGLHAHMKAVRAGVPALGLWLLAGSWSSNQLTDGWVPDYIAARLDPDYREHAATLVRAGLWIEDEHDGDKGWRFHQWDEHQPSAESVLTKREAARERMRRVRGQRGAGSQDVRANVRENFAGSAPNPDPTRPDPTNTELPSEVLFDAAPEAQLEEGGRKRAPRNGTRLPEDFKVTPDMVAWAREKVPQVNGSLETEKFCNYWWAKSGKDATKLDWKRTWQNWMLTASERSPNVQGRFNGGMLAESNTPRRIPASEVCPKHRGQRAGKCGLCRAEANGVRAGVSADA